jgi:hypothetical protein
VLPPVPDEPKDEQPKVKPIKPHEMIIMQGPRREKHTFQARVEVEEEEAQPESSDKPEAKKPEAKKPEKKAEDKAEQKKAPAKGGSAFGARSTRTGRAN